MLRAGGTSASSRLAEMAPAKITCHYLDLKYMEVLLTCLLVRKYLLTSTKVQILTQRLVRCGDRDDGQARAFDNGDGGCCSSECSTACA